MKAAEQISTATVPRSRQGVPLKTRGRMQGRDGRATTKTHHIVEIIAPDANLLRHVAGNPWAEIASASADEQGIDRATSMFPQSGRFL
jgi:hypothetical protein